MLNRSKLLSELDKVKQQLTTKSNECRDEMEKWWDLIRLDDQIAHTLHSRKWSLLVPNWQGLLAVAVPIVPFQHPYSILAVDGSQIYYDKHQGPACYLVNIGSVLFCYGQDISSVTFDSQPELVVLNGKDQVDMGAQSVDLYREQKELQAAVLKSTDCVMSKKEPFLCMLDGTLIFFQIDMQSGSVGVNFFAQFMQYLDQLYQHRVLHVAYMSFPRSKELVNIVRLVAANYQESRLEETAHWYKLSDMDIAPLFLTPGTRSIVFCSKAPIAYAYPAHLKPYFCYLNVGAEIVRLEFPWWIASNEALVDQVCSMVINQAEKGGGYPVALFEAHEQAVVKAADRDFFYSSLRKLHIQNDQMYQNSRKSSKKNQVPI